MRAVIPVSLPELDGDRISRAAAKLDETLSGFVRVAAVERANRVLGIDQTTVIGADRSAADAGSEVAHPVAVAS